MLMTGIFFLVFGFLLGTRSPEYLWFLITGMITWQWFETALNEGMLGIKFKLHILSQMPLPKYLFPVVNVGAATWKFLCVLAVILVANAIWWKGICIYWLMLPVIMLVQLGIIIGLSWLLAVATSYSEDTIKITQAVLRLLFYLSGVFFASDRVPVELQGVFWMNPMAVLMQGYRDILLYQQPPDLPSLAYAGLWALSLMVAGFALCKHIDKRLMKEVVA
jgi:lipopolysaccharide transport system permease protein